MPRVMPRRKANWVKTNVPWNIKTRIWQSCAKGDTITEIQHFFELHQGEYKGAPLDKKTIKKVIEELDNLPKEKRSEEYSKLVDLYTEYLSKKMPDNMKDLPQSFKDSIIDSAFNLGPSVFNYETLNQKIDEANTKNSEDDKNKTLLEALRLGILDTANESGKTMRGLAKRRANSYNRFAEAIGAEKIASVEQKEDGTIIYYDKDDNEIFKYKKPKHEKSDAIKENIK